MLMQAREIVAVPSERVAEDIVDPFSVAKGGFRYLLTCINMATRWPETVPLKKRLTVGSCWCSIEISDTYVYIYVCCHTSSYMRMLGGM